MTRTLGGERVGSLLHAVDLTVTPAGSRLLAERLAGPLTDPARIAARLDAVGFAASDRRRRAELRATLKRAPDMARALSRLSLGRGGPRDLASLRDGLAAAYALSGRLLDEPELPAELAEAAAGAGRVDASLSVLLGAALADELPLMARDGGFVRAGHDLALDEARELRDDTRRIVAALQARYVEHTEVRTLKIKHNNFLGFFIEVTAPVGETWRVPPHNALFIHRQTMAGAMRFSTTELAELESKISSAADRALTIERTPVGRARRLRAGRGRGHPRRGRRAGGGRRRLRARRGRRRARLDAAARRPLPRVPHRGRAPPRGGGGAQGERASTSSPTAATCRARRARRGPRPRAAASRW